MLADAKLPVTFWAKGFNIACYVQNRVLVNKSQNKTPYELFNFRTPAIGFLKPFGCHVMILNTLDNLGKFEAKGDEGYFIGYSMSSKAFRVVNKRTKRVEENLHVDFLENKAIEKGAGPNWLFNIDSLTNFMNYVPVVGAVDAPESIGDPNPIASTRNLPADQMETLTVETLILIVSLPVSTSCFTDSQKPSSDTKLISKRVTNQEETPSLDNILTLTNRFEDIIGVTTNSDDSNGVEANVLKNKKDERGIVIRNKAKLVAQGHTQEEGIDYDEIFVPVARIEAIRLFLAYASFMGFTVYQMDVKSAFLYGTIDEEVGTTDQTLFIKRKRGDFIRVQVYLDDIIFGSSNPHLGREFEALMHEKFQMSAMDVRSSNTPMDKENPWGKDGTGKDVDLHLYRSMIESLMYLTASRPDIMFAHIIVATSTTEAEYVAAASGCGQVLWIQNQLPDYRLSMPCEALSREISSSILLLIETTEEGTKVLATVDGNLRTISESSIRRNLKLNDEARISSLPDAELFENLTLMGYNISPNQKFTFQKGEGSGTPTEPRHTPFPEAHQTSPTTHSSPSLPPVPTKSLPTVIPNDTTPLRHYTKRARIAQFLAFSPIADEPASPIRDVSQAQELEINSLKARIKLLEDKDRGVAKQSGDDAPIKGRKLDEGEEAAERVSNNTEEMATVLTSMDATKVATATVSIPTGSGVVSTASPTIPTAALIFTTATESTPYTRRKG
nr:hypothetical protein [Tanacetum cinerariifolium]